LLNQVLAIGKTHKQVTWARTDYNEMQPTLKVDVKTAEAARLGLSKSDIANAVAMHSEGITATQVWENTLRGGCKDQIAQKLPGVISQPCVT
jgi:multidrug efflux pump subunit AcrB